MYAIRSYYGLFLLFPNPDKPEKIAALIRIQSKIDSNREDVTWQQAGELFFATRQGTVKKTALAVSDNLVGTVSPVVPRSRLKMVSTAAAVNGLTVASVHGT